MLLVFEGRARRVSMRRSWGVDKTKLGCREIGGAVSKRNFSKRWTARLLVLNQNG